MTVSQKQLCESLTADMFSQAIHSFPNYAVHASFKVEINVQNKLEHQLEHERA